jgi:phage protein D
MFRPAYRIVIGDHVVDSTSEPRASTAVELDVRLDLDTPVDGFSVVQGQVGGLRAAPGDDASIDLGYADEDGGLIRVLTGSVLDVEPGALTKRISGLGGGAALLRTFVDRTFEDTTAGAIVQALAGEAAVAVERTQDGLQLPAYVVDGRREVARHIRDLAYLCGFEAYLTPQGKLVFESLTGNRTVHVLRYGEHVLAAELVRSPVRAGTVQTWGEGPASGSGEAWAWLTKDFTPRRGSSGSGAPTLLVESGALRTAQAAAAAATAIATAIAAAALRGRVEIQGRPQVRLGDLVQLEGFPVRAGVDELDATYQVRAVRHRLDKTRGFVTRLDLRGLPSAATGRTA